MNTAIILAAGQGTRMNSQTAKVLHKVGNKSLLQHVIDASRPLVNSINVIIGHHSESVKKTTSNDDINWVNQKEQLGTGHAVQQAIPHINDNSICLILYGDVPLIKTETLQILTDKAESSGFSLLSVMMENPFGYGRIIRDSNNSILSIESVDIEEVSAFTEGKSFGVTKVINRSDADKPL